MDDNSLPQNPSAATIDLRSTNEPNWVTVAVLDPAIVCHRRAARMAQQGS